VYKNIKKLLKYLVKIIVKLMDLSKIGKKCNGLLRVDFIAILLYTLEL
jgi:hypothetical protein